YVVESQTLEHVDERSAADTATAVPSSDSGHAADLDHASHAVDSEGTSIRNAPRNIDARPAEPSKAEKPNEAEEDSPETGPGASPTIAQGPPAETPNKPRRRGKRGGVKHKKGA